jgi:release factor glutamine methyltransferase
MNEPTSLDLDATGPWLRWAASRLSSVSDTARLEAELLLACFAGRSRASVMAHPEVRIDSSVAAELAKAVDRRARGEPLAYIVGRKEFFALDLTVGAGVLVPRPETELVVEAALARHPAHGAHVLDLGTGSGAIALALKSERTDLHVTAVDSSVAALAIAKRNGMRLGLEVAWLQSQWFRELGQRRFELIVSNPPYVRHDQLMRDPLLRHEPRAALDGGADGLAAYRAILRDAGAYLEPGGAVVLEHGFDQRPDLIALAAEHSFAVVDMADDLAGQPRVVTLGRPDRD